MGLIVYARFLTDQKVVCDIHNFFLNYNVEPFRNVKENNANTTTEKQRQ